MRTKTLSFAALLLLFLTPLLATPAVADDEVVVFATDVWPIFERSCLQCHGAKEKFGNLRLDSPELILKGGDSGKVIEPGDPEASELLRRVALPPDDLDIMPVEGDTLPEEEIAVIRAWIVQGASFGDWSGPGS